MYQSTVSVKENVVFTREEARESVKMHGVICGMEEQSRILQVENNTQLMLQPTVGHLRLLLLTVEARLMKWSPSRAVPWLWQKSMTDGVLALKGAIWKRDTSLPLPFNWLKHVSHMTHTI